MLVVLLSSSRKDFFFVLQYCIKNTAKLMVTSMPATLNEVYYCVSLLKDLKFLRLTGFVAYSTVYQNFTVYSYHLYTLSFVFAS